jgi:hypothetical protein
VVTLVEALIFLVIVSAVGLLPTPLRQIGFAIVVLWVLSMLGIIAIAGLASILVLAIIVGLLAALLESSSRHAGPSNASALATRLSIHG